MFFALVRCNKTIIEFAVDVISRIISVGKYYQPQPSASADIISQDLNFLAKVIKLGGLQFGVEIGRPTRLDYKTIEQFKEKNRTKRSRFVILLTNSPKFTGGKNNFTIQGKNQTKRSRFVISMTKFT